MKKIAVIANPHSGPGRGRLPLDEAMARIRDLGFEVTALPTTGPGHAVDLARGASGDQDVVVAVGGDGTVHEVAKGLAGTTCPMGVLPSGSGNDFAVGIGCGTVEAGLEALATGRQVAFDTGRLNDQFFVNSLGLLASGLVSLKASTLWRWLGRQRYLVAAILTLLKYRGQEVRWQLSGPDGETALREIFLLAEICNGPLTGGGFRFAPEARFDDGQLDACLIRPLGLWTGLKLVGPASRGETLDHAAISLIQADKIVFSTETPVGYHLDGEPAMLPAGEHIISLDRENLKVLMP